MLPLAPPNGLENGPKKGPFSDLLSASRFSLRRLLVGVSCVAAAIVLPASAVAQQQDRSLMERIEKPDMTLSFGAQNGTFQGARGFSGGKDARVKDYYSPAKFRAKDYMTGSYQTKKSVWMGDFTYSTKGANTEGRGGTRRMVREHRTKTMAVRDSRDANKGYRTAQNVSANQSSGYRGKSQDKIDSQGVQALTSIPRDGGFSELKTIDDIRTLLNKN